jgi:surface protein
VKHVTDMNNLFYGKSNFNSDISSWDVSSVIDMGYMFYKASSFNQNLCPWGPKLPVTFIYGTYAYGMFFSSGCANKNPPTGRTGPWCAVTNCIA